MKRDFKTDIDLNGNKLLNATLENAEEGKIVTFDSNGMLVADTLPQQDISTKANKTIIAALFNTSSAYAVGDYVIYNDDLYRCTHAHQRATWNSGNFTLVSVGNELKAIKTDYLKKTVIAPVFSTSASYAVGDYVVNGDTLYKCTTAHSGAWNASDFAEVTVNGELKSAATNTTQAVNTEVVNRNAAIDAAISEEVVNRNAAIAEAIGSISPTGDDTALKALKQLLGISKNIYSGSNNDGANGNISITWEIEPERRFMTGEYIVLKFVDGFEQKSTVVQLRLTINDSTYRYNINYDGTQSHVDYMASGTVKVLKVTKSTTSTLRIGEITIVDSLLETSTPVGTIVMWSGSIDDIPYRWYLCDGTNGTPDLRSRFIVGASAEIVHDDDYLVNDTGGHELAKASFDITLDDIPRHAHLFVGDANIPTGWKDNASHGFSPAGPGDPSYQYDSRLADRGIRREYHYANTTIDGWGASGKGYGTLLYSGGGLYGYTDGANYVIDANTVHGATTQSAHKETNSFSVLPPYYALAFIMFKGY